MRNRIALLVALLLWTAVVLWGTMTTTVFYRQGDALRESSVWEQHMKGIVVILIIGGRVIVSVVNRSLRSRDRTESALTPGPPAFDTFPRK